MGKTVSNSSRKLNSMLSMWYGVIVGSLQVYLIVQNVWKFVRFAELPWPYQQTPTMELNIFIGLNGLVVLILPFFITTCFLKIGNLANDNQMVGKRVRCSDNWSTFRMADVSDNIFVSIWTHCGPISSLIHIICSICLLFPQVVMEAALIKYGFLSKDNVWKSDLDFMNVEDSESMVVRPISPNRNMNDLAKRVLPLTSSHDGLKLEFINYALALCIFSIRYAQVFWESHKKFAIILGLQQILNNFHSLISYCCLSVLYKVHVSSVYQQSTPFLLDSDMTMLIFAISLTVLFLSANVLYYFGFLKFTTYLHEKLKQQQQGSSTPSESSFYAGGWAYFPHSAAVSIALALAAAQSPLIHDAYIVYQISSREFLLAYPISCLVHFLLWAMLWLCLTLIKDWNFKINATLTPNVHGNAGVSAEITIDLTENSSTGPFSPSLLVISEGKAFTVNDVEDQRSILAMLPQQLQTPQHETAPWKTPTLTSTPTPSCLSYKQKHTKIKYMQCRKEVTFDDELDTERYYSEAPTRGDKPDCKSRGSESTYSPHDHMEEFDAGEYAYLSGERNCRSMKQSQGSRLGREGESPLYGQLPTKVNFNERSTVASPVSTVDSSSGVSSISAKSNYGMMSASASCSRFSEGFISTEEPNPREYPVVQPTAHYEPVHRVLARRNSMRAYTGVPTYEHISKYDQNPGQNYDSAIYGQAKTRQSTVRSEPIYSMGRSKLICDSRFNRSVYEKSRDAESLCNYSSNNPKFTDEGIDSSSEPSSSTASTSSSNNCKIYGYLDELGPPIPPPLPILSSVTRKSLAIAQSAITNL